MALQDVFLSPLGLAALLVLVPLVVLYLVQPDPRRVRLPTIRFLTEATGEDASHPLWERVKRSLLLVIQVLVVVALAVSLASPYVTVSESRTVEETVVVLDGSASMATVTDGATRFERASDDARSAITGTTTVIFAGADARVVLRSGGPAEAASAIDGLSVTDAPGDLGSAVSEAAAVAGERARIVVASDFAGDAGWIDPVRTARARGLLVDLRQFAGGGADNVGIVDRDFAGTDVTLSVKNYGDVEATRTVTLGDRRQTVSLGPGAVGRVTLPLPAGGGRATLEPGDSFPVDDAAYLAAPPDATVDVLLLSNEPDRYLTTALSVVDGVALTVDEPPTTVPEGYDVVVYGQTDPERLLRGSVEAGRDVVERGGGVVVIAQEDPPATYGDLLLVEPGEPVANPSIGRVATDELTRNIEFPPPSTALRGTLRSGTALVETTDGTPLLATERRGPGRVAYYGYPPEGDTFHFHYQYPVFWKRLVFYLAGRAPLESLNRGTGTRVQLPSPASVEAPDGPLTAQTLVLDRVGYYAVGERRIGVSLYSERESAVRAEPLEARGGGGGVRAREEEQLVPRPLTWLAALAALSLVVGEVAFLRRRGDL